MARRVCRRRSSRHAVRVRASVRGPLRILQALGGLALLVLSSCATPGPPSPSPASTPESAGAAGAPPEALAPPPEASRRQLSRLSAAEGLIAQRRYEEADAILSELARELSRQPDPAPGESGIAGRALLLRADVALSRGEPEAATFFLKQALEADPSAGTRFDANLALGGLCYEADDLEGAFRYYLEAVRRMPPGRSADDAVWLRLAHIAFYTQRNRELARYYLLQAPGLAGGNADAELLRRLLRRVSWIELGPETLGVGDGNVSAVAADGDDLWVGTWNGGVIRYTLGSGRAVVFREGRASLTANTVRSIEVTDSRIWIGTYQGLFVYSKPTSLWSEVPEFGGASPKRTEALLAVGPDLYAGTLGDGLWRLREGRWSRIAAGVLPGEFINALAYADSHVLIGTLNLGVVVLDPATESLWSFDRVNPNMEARNVILLLPNGQEELWIGTYGMGLYRWNRKENRLSHYDKAGGELGDDWVLCAAAASTGLYFGTFGAGASRYQDGQWRRVGLREGLAGLDVSAIAYAPPYLVFGTLGSGVALFDESLALAGFPVIE